MTFWQFLLISFLFYIGYEIFQAIDENEKEQKEYEQSKRLAQSIRDGPRLTYLERVRLAQDGPVNHALAYSLRKETERFYRKDWTVEEAQEELRLLSKDLEIAEGGVSPSQHSRNCGSYSSYCEACERRRQTLSVYASLGQIEVVDSVGDLERKIQHLLGILARLDFNAFLFAAANEKIRQVAEKFQLGTKIKRDLQELHAATLTNLQVEVERLKLQEEGARYQLSITLLEAQTQEARKAGTEPIEERAAKLHSLLEVGPKLKELYPAAEEEIERMIESERIRLKDEA